MPHRLDTETQVFCYVDEFYPLSNFSPFRLWWQGIDFDTSEHAYHWEKFQPVAGEGHPLRNAKRREVQQALLLTRSAHDAFTLAQQQVDLVRPAWPQLKVEVMRTILQAKVAQHEYVRRKLLETGDREIIEDSWRDSSWGWGPNKDGLNLLGKLWMEVREELRKEQAPCPPTA